MNEDNNIRERNTAVHLAFLSEGVNSEMLAAAAWKSYLEAGRGFIVIEEVNGKRICEQSLTDVEDGLKQGLVAIHQFNERAFKDAGTETLPNYETLKSMVSQYDPLREIVISIEMTADSGEFYGYSNYKITTDLTPDAAYRKHKRAVRDLRSLGGRWGQ